MVSFFDCDDSSSSEDTSAQSTHPERFVEGRFELRRAFGATNYHVVFVGLSSDITLKVPEEFDAAARAHLNRNLDCDIKVSTRRGKITKTIEGIHPRP